MSQVTASRVRRFSISGMFSNRNAFTTVMLGGSSGSVGWKPSESGVMTKLSFFQDVTNYATAGTVTCTVYKDGTTSSDDVFTVTFSVSGNGEYSGVDTTPEASPGAGFDTGSDWFIVVTSSGAPTPAYTSTFNYVLEGYYLG